LTPFLCPENFFSHPLPPPPPADNFEKIKFEQRIIKKTSKKFFDTSKKFWKNNRTRWKWTPPHHFSNGPSLIAWWHYQTCYKVVLISLVQSWYNKNVTRLTTQGCNNIVMSWLNRSCWNNFTISLIISRRLLPTWHKHCEHNLLTTC
jgi:hypothetical protein